MMKILKKSTQIIAILLILFFLSFLLLGCKPKMHEEGYFTYYYHHSTDDIIISELTELGRQQKVLVIPEEINGTKVTALSKWTFTMWDAGLVWESENLEKIFFQTSRLSVGGNTFDDCINLKRVILLDYDPSITIIGGGVRYAVRGDCYIQKSNYDYVEDARVNKNDYYDIKPANITYYYNYIANDSVWYWIDDVDYGEKIEYIPEDPSREEYEFGGWYKEAECINKWDFETDTLPEEQLEEVEVEATLHEEAYTEIRQVYQETKLYAKWIKE